MDAGSVGVGSWKSEVGSLPAKGKLFQRLFFVFYNPITSLRKANEKASAFLNCE
jgi:hypothetical protein